MRTHTLNTIYKIVPHILFLMIVLLAIFSPERNGFTELIPYLLFNLLLESVVLLNRKKWEIYGIFTILFGFILLWYIYSNYIGSNVSFLFPSPDSIATTLWTDIAVILKSIVSSFWLLLLGFVIAIALGVPSALIVGSSERLQSLVVPVAEILSSIPALVYAPYAVAAFPSFWSASLFIISSGLLWPVLLNTIKTINNINEELVDYSKTLILSKKDTLYHILLPYCVPGIFNTITLQISSAFMLLIGAEMMGMTSGVGWYVKYNSDFSNYKKVIVGFIIIGILVSLVNAGLAALRKRLLVWSDAGRDSV